MAKYSNRFLPDFQNISRLKIVDRQLLVHEETAQIISNAIAVATTLALPRLLVLFQVSLPLILRTTRDLPRLFPKRRRSRLTSHILETFRNADTIGAVASRLARRHLGMSHVSLNENDRHPQRRCHNLYVNFLEDTWAFSIICLGILFLGAFYLGIQAVAILTSCIVSTNLGLSSSPDCGWWVPPPVVSSKDSYQVPPFVLPNEAHFESITDTRRYHGTASISSGDSTFASQPISYQENPRAPCPFNRKYCAGHEPAFLADTGYQNSKVLGINTAEQYLFRVQAACSPLHSQVSDAILSEELEIPSLDRISEGISPMGNDFNKSIKQSYRATPGDSYDAMQISLIRSCENYNYLYKCVNGLLWTQFSLLRCSGSSHSSWTKKNASPEFRLTPTSLTSRKTISISKRFPYTSFILAAYDI